MNIQKSASVRSAFVSVLLISVLFFFSGFSALIYEVVWLRKLELVFGTTTYAVSTVLAVFFTGLAVGSWVFGKFVDTRILTNQKRMGTNDSFKLVNIRTNSLLLYGLLELGIGVYAALTPWIFKIIEGVQALVWQQFSPGFSGFSLVTFGLSFVGLLIPTVLMGGTFPVVASATARIRRNEPHPDPLLKGEGISRREGTPFSPSPSRERAGGEGAGVVGLLYGLNTLGAVLGVLAAGFFLIASIGVNQTIWVAAFISLAVGGIAVYLTRILTNVKRI